MKLEFLFAMVAAASISNSVHRNECKWYFTAPHSTHYCLTMTRYTAHLLLKYLGNCIHCSITEIFMHTEQSLSVGQSKQCFNQSVCDQIKLFHKHSQISETNEQSSAANVHLRNTLGI